MRILLMSDTHENFPAALRAVDPSEHFDKLIHLGDGCDDAAVVRDVMDIDLIQVAGNCDLGSLEPREILWECADRKILITHGDRYGVKKGLRAIEQRGLQVEADAVFFGHTHFATIVTMSGILLVNPGTMISTSQHKTCAIVEITPDGIIASLREIN
ncbi:MAG TPA: YfcE family phosphodiesterase [Deltaproteobacteria bacterium]|nr:YfcE family phosphodiesterase [Deltaproteobacteria bacterium]HQB38508.1 YfcE family phosphodiesterase [Deltaproteobacteria bacterium]